MVEQTEDVTADGSALRHPGVGRLVHERPREGAEFWRMARKRRVAVMQQWSNGRPAGDNVAKVNVLPPRYVLASVAHCHRLGGLTRGAFGPDFDTS